jgi:TRAP-type C4-dicarboxylate transport system permease small subunit
MKKARPLWFSALTNLDVIIACVMLAILIGVTFLSVIMRYFIDQPLGWSEEVQRVCMVWIVFSAGGAGFRYGNHVAIEMLVDIFPKRIQQVVQALVSVVVVAVLVYLIWQSVGFIQMFLASGRSTSFLRIPFAYIYMVAPVSFVVMIISYFYVLFSGVKSETKEAVLDE